MRSRSVPWIVLLFALPLLAACNMVGGGGVPQEGATPTLSVDEMATEISQMLTMMPTTTPEVGVEASPTMELPTVPVEAATETPAEAAPPEDTPIPSTPTEALEPEASPTVAEETFTPAAETATPAAETPTPAPPTATPTQPPAPAFTPPAGDPRQRLGAPTSTDSMDNPDTWIWPTGSDQFTRASFSGGSQAITALTGTDGWRMANPRGREFTNLYLEATFRTGTCASSDHYGVIVRVPVLHEPEQGYLFNFTCDGRYSLRRWNGLAGVRGEMTWPVNWTRTSAIATGSNQTNRMGIFTVGNRLVLYANGTLLTEVQDSTFTAGYFGAVVGSDHTDNLTIYIDEMSYWENPQP